MTFYELSIIATLSATFAVVCVYFFLFWLYRQTYIGLWAVFWLIHFVTQIFYRTPLHQIPTPVFAGIQFILIANYILLVFATSKFFGRKMHKGWYYWGIAVTLEFNIASFLGASIIPKAFPSVIYIAYIYFWHAWMFIRHLDSKSWGKTVVAIAFIGSGIHTLDMPFLVSVDWFVPWGFLISGTFRFIISIGTLMLYVERNFRDLVAKENQYRLLAENAADTIYLYRLKPSQKLDYISPSISKLTGYSPNEYYETPGLLFSLIHPSDAFWVESLVNSPVAVSTGPLIMRLIRRDHTVIWVEQTTVPILDDDGSCISFEGIIRDISTRKILEQDVSRLDRLNTVGQMAANVAHEIRNPLTTVKGYLQFFLKKPVFSSYHEHFTLLITELDRANLIIKEYLSLCQNKSRDLNTCQLNCIIQDIYPLIKAAANASSMDIHYIPETLPEIHLDEKEIRQLLLNLVRNGLESMEPGGVVTIRTYFRNDEVVLEIQDQGTGIPPHILENIGKPFLTTKDTGTGLGLAVVYRIANDHQAKIQVVSSLQGTTFHVIFKSK
ncbi:ATP-binding protein [Sporomusa sp.]|uniref:ATP-binding protein n=1 Tax=Sporomusa sp. TaxID=2078658 RepID=UPI002C6FBF92|nr:ATP-binding protein [Sporomusa sp.]HWR44213.1 ATP-binding protein [Sporomusa sp.]